MTKETISQPMKFKRGQHPNSRANLRPFPSPGDLNRQGKSLTLRLRESLDEPLAKPDASSSVREHLVYSTLEGALKREPTPFREVWDRVDGRLQDNPPQVQGVTVINILVRGEHMKEMLAKVAERTGELLPAGRETPIAETDETEAEG